MNYRALKELIAVFKKKLRCNLCNKSISNKGINIQSISEDRVQFKCTCTSCKNQIFAEVSIVKGPKSSKTKQRTQQALQLKSKKPKKITQNDILDVKNFLKSFKGDFKEIFKK